MKYRRWKEEGREGGREGGREEGGKEGRREGGTASQYLSSVVQCFAQSDVKVSICPLGSQVLEKRSEDRK